MPSALIAHRTVLRAPPSSPPLTGFWHDLFVGAGGTDLSAHTADVGGGYTKYVSLGAGTIVQLDGSGGAHYVAGNTGFGIYASGGVPAGADYTVHAYLDGTNLSGAIGIAGHILDGGNFLALETNGPGTELHLDRMLGGVFSALAAVGFTASANDLIELVFSGVNASAYLNGVLIMGPVAHGLPAAGSAGVSSFFAGTPSDVLLEAWATD